MHKFTHRGIAQRSRAGGRGVIERKPWRLIHRQFVSGVHRELPDAKVAGALEEMQRAGELRGQRPRQSAPTHLQMRQPAHQAKLGRDDSAHVGVTDAELRKPRQPCEFGRQHTPHSSVPQVKDAQRAQLANLGGQITAQVRIGDLELAEARELTELRRQAALERGAVINNA